MSAALAPWSVIARNLPDHRHNAIHTDAGAQAAGFPRALVAGVTTYAYLCHPIIAAWGVEWVAGGGAELRFAAPVFDGDRVDCTIANANANANANADTDPDGDSSADVVEARVDGALRATVRALPVAPKLAWDVAGEPLPDLEVELAGEFGGDYARRAGDDLDLSALGDIVHPAVWVSLANAVVHRHLVDGSWIHLRSTVAHRGTAPAGGRARVASRVVDRFTRRSGERAVVAVDITVDGAPVATLEHEAIVRLS